MPYETLKTKKPVFITDEVPENDGPISEPIPFSLPQLTPFQKQILNRNNIKAVTITVPGTSAATAANYGTFFVADRAYRVLAVAEEHRTAGTGTGSITIEKLESAEAEDAGDDLLQTLISLVATAATPQFGTLVATANLHDLRRGDRLALKDSGNLTGLAHVCVTVVLQEL